MNKLPKEEYLNALWCLVNSDDADLKIDARYELEQLINEHFGLQLTSSECDFIISVLEPYEDELGMDITLLIDKLKRIQSALSKKKGVVTCVEFEID